MTTTQPARRLPKWLTVRAPGGENYLGVRRLLHDAELHTVCEEARCPNIGECWERKSATFMILGDICTRACRYCAVTSGSAHRRIAVTLARLLWTSVGTRPHPLSDCLLDRLADRLRSLVHVERSHPMSDGFLDRLLIHPEDEDAVVQGEVDLETFEQAIGGLRLASIDIVDEDDESSRLPVVTALRQELAYGFTQMFAQRMRRKNGSEILALPLPVHLTKFRVLEPNLLR